MKVLRQSRCGILLQAWAHCEESKTKAKIEKKKKKTNCYFPAHKPNKQPVIKKSKVRAARQKWLIKQKGR